jgi:HTH-type transcriptional repressor of NAD biosynthesis genes
MNKAKTGFTLGKFMPPHQGHVFMCEFARQYCEHLTILVCSLPDEPIPGELRYKWMKELFPDCTVLWTNETLPQEPVGEDPEFWSIWQRVVRDAFYESTGQMFEGPEVLFASEAYGQPLANQVGARFVPVDIDRTTRSVSGTAIRNDPFGNWEYIPHVVRPYFTKRVTLFGPESSGKSTLAKQLGEHYKTVVVPEYGRTYVETFNNSAINKDELTYIVQGHLASVAAAKRQANKLLIEDTDPVMSGVWSHMLFGATDPWFAEYNDYADLYLLCDVDIPWEDDGTRYLPNQEDRKRFFNICQQELINRGVRYVVVKGDREARFNWAKLAIDKLVLDS